MPLATCFAALQLGLAADWKRSLVLVAALCIHLFCLMRQPDFLAAYFQLAVLFLLGLAGRGFRLPKTLLAVMPLLPFALLLRAMSHYSFRWETAWHPADSELSAKWSYQVGQMLKAFRSAGLWGAENPEAARLVFPQDIFTNALPYLSLHWGNLVTGACLALILALLLLLLKGILRQQSISLRNVLLGLWGFAALAQLWSCAAPFYLVPFSIGFGTAFLGSSFMGCLILLIGLSTNKALARSRTSVFPSPEKLERK